MRAALRVERRVGKPVNVTIRTPEAWARRTDGFLQHVAASDLAPIISCADDETPSNTWTPASTLTKRPRLTSVPQR